MSPLWAVLTASALALAVAGWLPRSLRPAPTIAAAVLVMATAAVAISVLGMNRPFLLIFLGAAVGLGFAIGHRRASGGGGSVARRLARWGLALSATALSVGLVCCGAAGATAFPAFTPPTPPQLPRPPPGSARAVAGRKLGDAVSRPRRLRGPSPAAEQSVAGPVA